MDLTKTNFAIWPVDVSQLFVSHIRGQLNNRSHLCQLKISTRSDRQPLKSNLQHILRQLRHFHTGHSQSYVNIETW